MKSHSTPTSTKRTIPSPEIEDKQADKKSKESDNNNMDNMDMNKKIDSILVKLETLDKLEGGVASIGADLQWLKTEIVSVRVKYDEAKAEINVLKQRLQLNSFVLFGLPPMTQKSDVFPVVQKYVGALGYKDLVKEDLRSVYAINMKNGSGCRIGGEFYDLRKKDTIFNLAKTRNISQKPVLVEHVLTGLDMAHLSRGKKVTMMQALTPETIVVLNEARKLKGTTFEFVWVKDGQIKVRQANGSRAYDINSVKQLKEIAESIAPPNNN